jgi:hypothetical protein
MKHLFTAESIAIKISHMVRMTLPLESLRGVLQDIENIQDKSDGIWNPHFGQWHKVSKPDYVFQVGRRRLFVESANLLDSRIQKLRVRWKPDFVPVVTEMRAIPFTNHPNPFRCHSNIKVTAILRLTVKGTRRLV